MLQTISLDEILASFQGMKPEEKKEVVAAALASTVDMKWVPSPGPQTQAYLSKADVLLYGGQGGGGKSDLGLGLAFTAHKRSLIMRRKYANLSSLTERAIAINGTRSGFNGSPPPLIRTSDGRYVQFGANQHLGDEQDWQGHAFDYKFFDEACQFMELQIRFHLGWLRDADGSEKGQGQRVRAVLGSNPPLDPTGDWLIKMFRPWLDLTYPKPKASGELAWFVTAPDGSDLEVDDDTPVELDGKKLDPSSRTFIPAALSDNPYLVNTGYQAKLDALPEPLRSAVRDGNFMAAREDADFQVIPLAWIIAAQARWKEDGWKASQMTAMGYDPAGGGKDAAELAWRHLGWYAPLVSVTGEITKDGSASVATIIKHRRANAPVVVDVGGGYGGGVCLRLNDNKIPHVGFNGAGKSTGRTSGRSKGQLNTSPNEPSGTSHGQLMFVNMRAEAWWRFREELDPDQEGGSPIALPPDPELRADLAAPVYQVKTNGILIESKDDLRKRLGRSPGKGDAVVMCLSEGNRAVRSALWKPPAVVTSSRDWRSRR